VLLASRDHNHSPSYRDYVVAVSQYRQLMHPLCLTALAESSCRTSRFINDTGDWDRSWRWLRLRRCRFNFGRLLPMTAGGGGAWRALGIGQEP
jgi:hypothetical protein